MYLEKSAEAIVALYGVLKAGAAYVPLGPNAPPARLAYIARDCGIAGMLSAAEKASSWGSLREHGAPIETFLAMNRRDPGVDERAVAGSCILGPEALDAQLAVAPVPSISGSDLAYVLYTSGSTGRPKGAMLSHRNGLAFVDWAAAEFAVSPADRLSSHAPLHFDLSIFDVFAADKAGAAVVLVPREVAMFPLELVRFVEDSQITTWYSVPSALNMIVQKVDLAVGSLPRLRTVLFAGEVFPTPHLRSLISRLPHARFCNLYGPTETNVCTWYDVRRLPDDDAETIPIGTPIDEVETFVVTDEGVLAADGDAGELYVRGPTVMQGYWGDAERTASSLVALPANGASRRSDALAYPRGDLVRRDEDGCYRYLGRRDTQIKCRGYRIELGEVQAALSANPAVVECSVLALPDELITNTASWPSSPQRARRTRGTSCAHAPSASRGHDPRAVCASAMHCPTPRLARSTSGCWPRRWRARPSQAE